MHDGQIALALPSSFAVYASIETARRESLQYDAHHTSPVRLLPQQAPPPHYYATNLLAVMDTVLERYGDILSDVERGFGERIRCLPTPAVRLLARLVSRKGPWLREDALDYEEVGDAEPALADLVEAGLVERCPPAPTEVLLRLLRREELARCFAWELRGRHGASKSDCIDCILAATPAPLCRWRIRRSMAWLELACTAHLDLYRLLFFGDRRQDLTTFVMRDLGIYRFEAVELCPATRQFPDRAALDRLLTLMDADDAISALGKAPASPGDAAAVDALLALLWTREGNRALEHRRSHALNRLGRNLERGGDFDAALTCYARSTLAPGRERRLRILHRLGDGQGVAGLRRRIAAQPQTALEADFAMRFAQPFRRRPVPICDRVLSAPPAAGIEQHALAELLSGGGMGWHLENGLPMAIFALAYWSWIFAPVEGAFLNPFQTGPADLFWPDFFASREAAWPDPLAPAAGPLKPRLRAAAGAKAGVANRLFSWHRFPPGAIEAVIDALPEEHLRALVDIVRSDLAGFRSGFPDLTVVYAPGRYEFVEVKGPNDRLQIHQRLWIRALEERQLPVRVLRYRVAR